MWLERQAPFVYICSLYVHIATSIPPTSSFPLPTSNSPFPAAGDIIRVMQNSITWLDRLRSRLTGQPAKVFATRRLARADLHALEAKRAHAVARLTEDIELIDRYVNPLERYMDGNRLLTPLGTILDRRSGKNLPLVWTELDLREFRRWARVICDVNPFAVGFLGLLTDFHIRQGFGWQVVLRGARGMGPGVSQNETSSLLAPHPIPLAPIQALLDTWRDATQWGIRSREAFRRWRRDGEVFIRFFRGGSQTRGLPVVRFVEPEQVGPPPGEDADGDWSFGILTDREDVENVQAYFVRDPLGTGSEGDEVPAARILHLKANVDSSIKRGLPDFMPVQDDLERVRRMLRNMGEVAAVQTAIAWVSQYATATADQVGTLIRAGSDYTRPKLGDPSGKYMDVVIYEPGTVIHMDSNRQFVAGPVAQGTAGFIQVEQAILRGCGARWRFPEYFSGDASNNNMASSIVAGSPFVVAVEGNQLEWGVFERAVAKKVLELCVESGRLSREQVASVDVKVIPPAVALANREEEERLREMRNRAGVLSVTTWQQQVGLDPKHEAANFEAEARRKGARGGETIGESEENCDCDEISEGMLRGKKFTGEIRDSLGRRRCYHKGKQIPCRKLGQIIASSRAHGLASTNVTLPGVGDGQQSGSGGYVSNNWQPKDGNPEAGDPQDNQPNNPQKPDKKQPAPIKPMAGKQEVIQVYLDGSGQNVNSWTSISRFGRGMGQKIADDQNVKYLKTPVLVDLKEKVTENLEKSFGFILAKYAMANKKGFQPPLLDILGWSRGGTQAILLAQALKNFPNFLDDISKDKLSADNKEIWGKIMEFAKEEYKNSTNEELTQGIINNTLEYIRKNKEMRVRFLGAIDPVATSMNYKLLRPLSQPSETELPRDVPDNVDFLWLGKKKAEYNKTPWNGTLFPTWGSDSKDGIKINAKNNWDFIEDPNQKKELWDLTHSETGWNERVYLNLLAGAQAAGVDVSFVEIPKQPKKP